MVTFHEDKLARAHRSGKHVAESLRKGVENAEYIGEPGMCPLCHSKLIEVRHGNEPYPCMCALCGVRGTLTTDADGSVRFTVSEEDRPHSHLLLSGKFEHFQELADRSLKAPAGYSEVNARAQKYRDYLTPLKPPARDKGKKAEEGEEL